MARLSTLSGAAGLGEGIVQGVRLGMDIDEQRERKTERAFNRERTTKLDTLAQEDREFSRKLQGNQEARAASQETRAGAQETRQQQSHVRTMAAQDIEDKIRGLRLDQAKTEALRSDVGALMATLSAKESGDGSMVARTITDPLTPDQQRRLSGLTGMHVTNAGVWYEKGQKPEDAMIHVIGINEQGEAVTTKIPWKPLGAWAKGGATDRGDGVIAVSPQDELYNRKTGERIRPGQPKPSKQSDEYNAKVDELAGLQRKAKALQSQRDQAKDETDGVMIDEALQKVNGDIQALSGELDSFRKRNAEMFSQDSEEPAADASEAPASSMESPPVAGAKWGKDPDGNAGWYVKGEDGKWKLVE